MSTPASLDELVVTVIVDNETDNLSSISAGIPPSPLVSSLPVAVPQRRRLSGYLHGGDQHCPPGSR